MSAASTLTAESRRSISLIGKDILQGERHLLKHEPSRRQLALARAAIAHREGADGPFLPEVSGRRPDDPRPENRLAVSLELKSTEATTEDAQRFGGPTFGVELADRVYGFNDDQSLHLIGTPHLLVDGTVGVGTTSPRTTVHVIGRISTGLDFNSAGAVTFFPPDGFAWFHIDNGPSGGRSIGRLRICYGAAPGDNEVINILQNGAVGVGPDSPRAKLHVNGSIRATGDIVLENADCAEEFDLAGGAVEPGTVMTHNEDATESPSEVPYDRRVAGVVSGAGSLRPALVLDKRDGSTSRAPLALLGKVFCKADASESPIAVGDLLTTSSTLGRAMKASDRDRAFGAVLGKALGPLNAGRGLVPVLVTLQ